MSYITRVGWRQYARHTFVWLVTYSAICYAQRVTPLRYVYTGRHDDRCAPHGQRYMLRRYMPFHYIYRVVGMFAHTRCYADARYHVTVMLRAAMMPNHDAQRAARHADATLRRPGAATPRHMLALRRHAAMLPPAPC